MGRRHNFRQQRSVRIQGFTLVELVTVMMILGVLSAGGGYLMFHFIKNAVYVPNKLNMDMLVSDALDLMVDGDSQARGLRSSKAITAMANNSVTFTDINDVSVNYQLNAGKLYRTIGAGSPAVIPYYVPAAGVTLSTPSNLFTYYDASETVIASGPANVRRVLMTLSAATGNGSYAQWNGQSQQSTSIAVKSMQ